jgi:predicted GTPase
VHLTPSALRSDLVIFVTTADRPLSESERQFLEKISAWGKKAILVVNKRDLLPDSAAEEEVMAFVEASVARQLWTPARRTHCQPNPMALLKDHSRRLLRLDKKVRAAVRH